MENTETQVSPDFAMKCEYVTQEEYKDLLEKSEEVGRKLNRMVENPEKYVPRRLPTAQNGLFSSLEKT